MNARRGTSKQFAKIAIKSGKECKKMLIKCDLMLFFTIYAVLQCGVAKLYRVVCSKKVKVFAVNRVVFWGDKNSGFSHY